PPLPARPRSLASSLASLRESEHPSPGRQPTRAAGAAASRSAGRPAAQVVLRRRVRRTLSHSVPRKVHSPHSRQPEVKFAMLEEVPIHATLPCSDFERAKAFYADKLGLNPASESPGGAFYHAGRGTRFFLYPSAGTASGAHTQMGFAVDDIDASVRDLKARGV